MEADLYRILFYGGLMTASQLAKSANISRTSVYDILKKMSDLGLIIETQQNNIKQFTIQPPEKIKILINEKEKEIIAVKRELGELSKDYKLKKQEIKPKLQIYEGREALQQMMKDLLLYRDITIYVFWPIKKIVELLTPDFMSKFHKERIERNISIKAIWPASQSLFVQNHSFLKIDPNYKREVRIAPKNIDFSLGYSIYNNSIRYISSSKENFGFIVESIEMAEMMRSQFDLIWEQSKPIKIKTSP